MKLYAIPLLLPILVVVAFLWVHSENHKPKPEPTVKCEEVTHGWWVFHYHELKCQT